jgi:hypothetical protein
VRWLLVIVAALVLAPAAAASNVATPRMNAVAAWGAGKPVTVWCENDAAAWDALARSKRGVPGGQVGGFTIFAEPVVYVGPSECGQLGESGFELGSGLNILLHEAAHQRGFRDDDLAECAARVLIYSALHDFYSVPWYSQRMRQTVDFALAVSLAKPAAYQNGCARIGG